MGELRYWKNKCDEDLTGEVLHQTCIDVPILASV
ncbi:predicted protein [Sclerotinia sclerotiorum 1980 UF-70]|uniref:Uncharacterized protein n=1 Tax=Sclerotinia sclerotiorum (strain ATCC 18683 / 1980 / Ss-1) TaxID=665079 RepID=A7ERF4_SCLS1|nr:predicted protein [Sclerotinia sclerotiorum 1980 UF-70]EDN92046.1 predicted protein [Sclerotinia sclerotiorum 1980 UF-70]